MADLLARMWNYGKHLKQGRRRRSGALGQRWWDLELLFNSQISVDSISALIAWDVLGLRPYRSVTCLSMTLLRCPGTFEKGRLRASVYIASPNGTVFMYMLMMRNEFL